jgi:hypothetical protein
MATAPSKPSIDGVSDVLEILHRVRDREGVAGAREAAREMLVDSIAKLGRRATFGRLVAAVCILQEAD